MVRSWLKIHQHPTAWVVSTPSSLSFQQASLLLCQQKFTHQWRNSIRELIQLKNNQKQLCFFNHTSPPVQTQTRQVLHPTAATSTQICSFIKLTIRVNNHRSGVLATAKEISVELQLEIISRKSRNKKFALFFLPWFFNSE